MTNHLMPTHYEDLPSFVRAIALFNETVEQLHPSTIARFIENNRDWLFKTREDALLESMVDRLQFVAHRNRDFDEVAELAFRLFIEQMPVTSRLETLPRELFFELVSYTNLPTIYQEAPKRQCEYVNWGLNCVNREKVQSLTCETLARCLKAYGTKIWHLVLPDDCPSDRVLEFIQYCPELDSLDCARVKLDLPTVTTLVNLPHVRNLTSLTLKGCELGVAGVKAINQSPFASSLAKLKLAACCLGNEGAKALANASFPNLVSLSLSCNPIEPVGVEALVQAPWPKLTKLKLHGTYVLSGDFDKLKRLGRPSLEIYLSTDRGYAQYRKWEP